MCYCCKKFGNNPMQAKPVLERVGLQALVLLRVFEDQVVGKSIEGTLIWKQGLYVDYPKNTISWVDTSGNI